MIVTSLKDGSCQAQFSLRDYSFTWQTAEYIILRGLRLGTDAPLKIFASVIKQAKTQHTEEYFLKMGVINNFLLDLFEENEKDVFLNQFSIFRDNLKEDKTVACEVCR